VGIWAMVPLKNGIANVVEYKADGSSILQPFNCSKPDKKDESEHSSYSINSENDVIAHKSEFGNFDLKILEINQNTMKLEQKITDDFSVSLLYIKVDKVSPLCYLYAGAVNEPPKTGYTSNDFTPSPVIPANADINKYIGKWALEDDIQIEIAQDKNGQIFLKKDRSENWNHLYNNARWINNELHYESYSYSDKKSLYNHPFHKSQHSSILKIISDEKLLYSFFIDDKQYDYELIKLQTTN
ncbi:hypothetical protein, partial [Providencia heimbachae]